MTNSTDPWKESERVALDALSRPVILVRRSLITGYVIVQKQFADAIHGALCSLWCDNYHERTHLVSGAGTLRVLWTFTTKST